MEGKSGEKRRGKKNKSGPKKYIHSIRSRALKFAITFQKRGINKNKGKRLGGGGGRKAQLPRNEKGGDANFHIFGMFDTTKRANMCAEASECMRDPQKPIEGRGHYIQ